MQSPRGAIFLQGASPWPPAGAGAGRTDYRYLFVGIRYFSVFELSTSISVSVFQNIALSVWFFGIPITSSWAGRMTYVQRCADMYPRIDILRISAILTDTDRTRIVISLLERIRIRILCHGYSTDTHYALMLFCLNIILCIVYITRHTGHRHKM